MFTSEIQEFSVSRKVVIPPHVNVLVTGTIATVKDIEVPFLATMEIKAHGVHIPPGHGPGMAEFKVLSGS